MRRRGGWIRSGRRAAGSVSLGGSLEVWSVTWLIELSQRLVAAGQTEKAKRGRVGSAQGALVFCADTFSCLKGSRRAGVCPEGGFTANTLWLVLIPPAHRLHTALLTGEDPLHHVPTLRLKHQIIFPPVYFSRLLVIHYL